LGASHEETRRIEVLSEKVIAVHRGAWHIALDNGRPFQEIEFFDAPAERHILGAQLPKFLDSFCTLGGGKSTFFGDRGAE
jgi:hypothetical protein